jgi:hypothetical protein
MMAKTTMHDLLERIALLERQLAFSEADNRWLRGEVLDRDEEIRKLDRALDDGGVYDQEVD